MIRILIVDDHRLEREAFRAILHRDKEIQVLGEGKDGQEAVRLADQYSPDVVLMDIYMPRYDGLWAARHMQKHHYKNKVLIVAASYDDDQVLRALQSGASGYISKHDAFTELIPAVRAVCKGDLYFSESIPQSLRNASV